MITSTQEQHREVPVVAGEPMVVALRREAARVVSAAGGKGARLAELTALGLPVPGGFVVTTSAARAFAARHGLTAESTEGDVAGAAMPEPIAVAIRAALAELGDGAVAVRSSALAEDLATASFAGLYESILDVRGADAVIAAVTRVWASAHAARVRSYDAEAAGCVRMAVIVQRMVPAGAAGVAFTADPVTGARDVTIVSAVRGLGERLVSGVASAEEWRVTGAEARRVRDDGVLDVATVRAIAALANRVAAHAGAPQDLEWAVCGGELALLQARPITALPDEVRWDPPPWGGWVRNFRLGEWIGDPVTPAFESWLLTDIEAAAHAHMVDVSGWPMPSPGHVIVNGWYFYGLNIFGPERFAKLRVLARVPLLLWKLVTRFRAVAGMMPPLAHLGFDWGVREWREQLLPRYRALVAEAEREVPRAPIGELGAWIDRIAAVVGRNFGSLVAVGGYAAKAELPLAQFWTKHLSALQGSWLEVVRAGRAEPPATHDVQGLDWFHPTLGELGLETRGVEPEVARRVATERDATIARARAALPTPKLVAKFDKLVAEARRAHDVREEQTRAMTLAWPVLRVAILRIGAHLVERGLLASAEQVFFVERAELAAALAGATTPLAAIARARRTTWERQRRLAVPLVIGTLSAPFDKVFAMIDGTLHGASAPAPNELRGYPGSPGRATGRVRVLRSPDELARLAPGEILVATVTTPAWTPAFTRAAAIVTDTGSIASHASIVAREYGIPAVVATGDATSRLQDGQTITVDGHRGVVIV